MPDPLTNAEAKLQAAESKQNEIDSAFETERKAKEQLSQDRKFREKLQEELANILRTEDSPLFEQPAASGEQSQEQTEQQVLNEVNQ